MEGPQRCSVQVTINGRTQVMNVRLGPGITVDYVEGKVKNVLGVVDGMLSHHEGSLEMVNGLEAGRVYYFFRFPAPQGTQAPPLAGRNSSRDDAYHAAETLTTTPFSVALTTVFRCSAFGSRSSF